MQPFLETQPEDAAHCRSAKRSWSKPWPSSRPTWQAFQKDIAKEQAAWKTQKTKNGELRRPLTGWRRWPKPAEPGQADRSALQARGQADRELREGLGRRTVMPGAIARSHAPARQQTKPASGPSSRSSRCATSGGRPLAHRALP